MFRKKIILIYFPFLIVGILFTAIYNPFYWLIFIKFDLFNISEEITHFGIPFILLTLLIFIWIWPKIKLLNLGSHGAVFFAFAAVSAIGLPNWAIQSYLEKASGEMTQLPNMSSINQHEKTKYYTLKEYYVGRRELQVHASREWRGLYNDQLHLTLFFVMPIYDSIVDPALHRDPSAWLGFKFQTEMKSSLTESQKDGKIDAFVTNTIDALNARNVQQFAYLDRISSSNERDGYLQAIKKNPKFNPANSIVLKPIDTPFEDRNQGGIGKLLFYYAVGAFLWLALLLFPKFDRERLNIFLDRPHPRWNFIWRESFSYFLPSEGYFITPLLLDLNLLIFLLMFFSGAGFNSMHIEDLLKWGANYGPHIDQGEYWRWVSSMFLHDGFLHLAGNMFALVYLGTFLEPFLGKLKMLLAYLATGMFASFVSYYWSGEIRVGASGAVLGLSGLGILFFKMTDFFESESKDSILQLMVVIPVCTLLAGFIYQNIDNANHIGGFLSGCLFGFLIVKWGKIHELGS